MISQNVITAVLIGIVITGIIPAIGWVVLLVTGKIKGSGFWAGVLAYIIGFIVSSIAAGLSTLPFAEKLEKDPGFIDTLSIIVNLAMFVILILSMMICIRSCMKRTRSFKGGISCGLGFGMAYSITSAIGFISSYYTFSLINSGEFDRQYMAIIEQGLITKEQFAEAKSVFTLMTVQDMIMQITAAIGIGLVLTASGVFIMNAVCAKNTFPGFIISAIITSAGGLSTMIPNFIAASVIPVAIGAAALIFAFRVKDKAVPQNVPAAKDDFLTSIENVKKDNTD